MGIACAFCGRRTLKPQLRFCTTCWAWLVEFKGQPWLRELINATERERYYQVEVAPRLVSLDLMVERGQMQFEQIEPHGAAARRRSRPKQRRKG